MRALILFPVAMIAVLALAACASMADGRVPSSAAARGRAAAERQCAQCHAIGAAGESPRASAPPFRQIRMRYAGVSLERELEAITQVGHYEMRQTPIGATDIKDLTTYIEGLGDR